MKNSTFLLLFVRLLLVLIPSNTSAAVFTESFDDNQANWPFIKSTKTYDARIENGVLYWSNKANDTGSIQRTYLTPGFDFETDFRLSVTLRYVSGPKEMDFGFAWQRAPKNAEYHELRISPRGNVSVFSKSEGIFRVALKPINVASLATNEPNTVNVYAIGRDMYYFVNDKLIGISPKFKVSGDQITLYTTAGITAEFDEISLKNLSKSEKRRVKAEFDEFAAAFPEKAQPLIEDFDSNTNQWPHINNNANRIAKISNGALYFENLPSESPTKRLTLPVPIDGRKNFSVSMRVKYEKGEENKQFGIVWDFADTRKWARREFNIGQNGWLAAFKYDGKSWTTTVPWMKTNGLIGRDYNTLEIRKLADTAFYLINDQVVASEPISKLLGKFVGVRLPDEGAVSVDHYYVTYLNVQASKETEQLAGKLKESIHRFEIAQGPKTENFIETFDDNRNKWPFEGSSDGHSLTFINGEMVQEHFNDSLRWTYIDRQLNTKADFKLSLTFQHKGGVKNRRIGLLLGKHDAKNYAAFGIAPTDYYLATQMADGKEITGNKWTKIELVEEGSNKLTIEKVKDSYFLYVNGQLLQSVAFTNLNGGKIGVFQEGKSKVAFDELTLNYQVRSLEDSQNYYAKLDKKLLKLHRSGKVEGAQHPIVVAELAREKAEKDRLAKLKRDSKFRIPANTSIPTIKGDWSLRNVSSAVNVTSRLPSATTAGGKRFFVIGKRQKMNNAFAVHPTLSIQVGDTIEDLILSSQKSGSFKISDYFDRNSQTSGGFVAITSLFWSDFGHLSGTLLYKNQGYRNFKVPMNHRGDWGKIEMGPYVAPRSNLSWTQMLDLMKAGGVGGNDCVRVLRYSAGGTLRDDCFSQDFYNRHFR